MATFHISHKSRSDSIRPHPWAVWAGPGQWTVDIDEAKKAAGELFDKLDTDKDGTLDTKELKGRLTQKEFTAADPDNDGMSNWAEFLAGTNPTNSASVLQVTAVTREGNDLRITWTMGTGKTNVLQHANTLAGTGNFTDAFTVATVGSVTNCLDVSAVTSAPARFYRVRLGP